MNKTLFIIFLPILLLCNSVNAIEISRHLSTTTEPTPTFRVDPKYPKNAARNSREGWARFSFIIEKDGSVSNVITKETSGSEDITLAAKKAVMQWKYQPAMEDGEPIQQCANSVQLSFKMNKQKNSATGATRRFQHLYSKTKAALAENNYVEAKELLNKFKKIKHMHLSENNFLQLLSAQYASEIGDPALQLSHLNKISFSAEPESHQQVLSILKQKFILEIKLNQLKPAYNTFKRLEKIAADEPYLADYQALIKRVDEFVNSDKELVITADIRQDDYWYYALVRNEFTLTNITGKLTKMDIRCANKRHVYTIENNNTWKLPDAWQQCNVYIFGQNNTTFNLIEHPFKA
ncbi:energy transducer TonB [Colwellia sp. BRX10-3]|uniref:energy transducer TonB n=1 Tax=Colwellia sp. BRX10-3 TaxID=2759844 RepID=UPI0015F54299|nr:energy transducer TonB [Colwellia sp. BRX10-3]MBA6390727.1 energy transducer TonB [Colwellia sp. BRX10-3]